jgi:hypothetical protein
MENKTMAKKINIDKINDAHEKLVSTRVEFLQTNRTGKDKERLSRLEDAIRNLEILQIMVVLFVAIALAACGDNGQVTGDGGTPGFDARELDAVAVSFDAEAPDAIALDASEGRPDAEPWPACNTVDTCVSSQWDCQICGVPGAICQCNGQPEIICLQNCGAPS